MVDSETHHDDPEAALVCKTREGGVKKFRDTRFTRPRPNYFFTAANLKNRLRVFGGRELSTVIASGRGRRPKPTAQKKLAGNPGKRALNNAEPKFSDAVNIDAPVWFGDRAKTMWETLVPELLREKVLCITDMHNVEAFCIAYDKWRLSEESVQALGIIVESAQGGPMKNPALTAANEAMRQMTTFGSLLGLDPSSRSRIIGGGKGSSDNPFASLLSG